MRTAIRRVALLGLLAVPASPLAAQAPLEGEVRQIVTFALLPGGTAEVVDLFRDRALPLYRENEAMRSVRIFREVESPVPLDLVVVSSFEGMEVMDRSNASLRSLAEDRGTSIRALYGEIAARSRAHADEFVEMLPELGGGDPAAAALSVFIRYRVAPGTAEAFETAVVRIAAWEDDMEIPSTTGRFLISDGWDYLRILGFDSLAEYHEYRQEERLVRGYDALTLNTVRRQEIVLSGMPDLQVR